MSTKDFSGEELLALGIVTRRAKRAGSIRDFLHGVVRRREPNYGLAMSALHKNSLKAEEGVLHMFMNPTDRVLRQRIRDICKKDSARMQEAVRVLELSAAHEEKRLRASVEQANFLRLELTANPENRKGTKLHKCLARVEEVTAF